MYALHSERSWGAGDFTDLEDFVDWTARAGGGVIATLPLLAAFLDEPCDPSPYSPVSRCFWNEFYVDITRLPELDQCPEAQQMLNSSEFAEEIAALRAAEYVDYRRQMGLKRQVLDVLARHFFAGFREYGLEVPAPAETEGVSDERIADFRRFLEEYPDVEEYARFRAVHEKLRTPWRQWPAGPHEREIGRGDYDDEALAYHLYAQWAASRQLESLADHIHEAHMALYLDLPLGVRQDGYDVWRYRDIYVDGMNTGAPPDDFFTKGQNWGFAPMHPHALRRAHYGHFIEVIRHHLQLARLLRIDHVMGLHRLYWIPAGMPADKGVYVQYHAEELYGILSLESHRFGAGIVGENLGTVPEYVNQAMSRHNLRQMYVLQYENQPDPERALRSVPRGSVASLNTHDMPTFAAHWNGEDIADRHDLGLLKDDEVEPTERERARLRQALVKWLSQRELLPDDATDPETEAVLRACLRYLAESRAQVVLVNLEDLWLERRPQNVPGTLYERPNWTRKAQHRLEEFRDLSEVSDVLREVDARRRRRVMSDES